MKDILLIGVAATFLIASALFFYRSDRTENTAEKTSVSNHTSQTKPGVIYHERTNSRGDTARARIRQGEGIAKQDSEGPQLPSLFKGTSRESVGRDHRRKDKSELSKVVYGVPTEEWAAERRNALPLRPITPESKDGMRIFVQCMELKKAGPSYVGNEPCNELAKGQKAERVLLRGQAY